MKIYSFFQVLVRNIEDEDATEEPSSALEEALGPEIRVKRVLYEGFEQCRETKKETHTNNYPVPRNQIDQLNATVGQLLVFRVPKVSLIFGFSLSKHTWNLI